MKIILLTYLGIINICQAGELILTPSKKIDFYQEIFCVLPEMIKTKIYDSLELKEVIKLSEISKAERNVSEKYLEKLIILHAVDKKIAKEQLPHLKKTFGSFKKLFHLGIPIDFINDSYVTVAKIVQKEKELRKGESRNQFKLLKTNHFSSYCSANPLYILPFYDEAQLIFPSEDKLYHSFIYPEYDLKFSIAYENAKFTGIITKGIEEDFTDIPDLCAKIYRVLNEKDFLKQIWLSIRRKYQYFKNSDFALEPRIQNIIKQLERQSLQKHFSIGICLFRY